MAAPQNNQFWKLRSKHGRDKLFASPDLLWKAAEEYFQWCDQHPWIRTEQLKKPAIVVDPDTFEETQVFTVDIPTARPYTLTGLCLYLGCGEAYFRQFTDEAKEEFSTALTRIRETIFTQKFEGAAVGAFNATIIARDLGLVEKKDFTTAGEKIGFDYSKLSNAALEEIAGIAGAGSGQGKR